MDKQFGDTGSLGNADPAQVITANDFIDQRRFVQKTRQTFEQLRESLRTVFALRELEGASTEEVAKILGISPDCVRQCLLRARRAILAIRSAWPLRWRRADRKDVTSVRSILA